MGHLEGTSRAQHILCPEALDDYMAAENPVRCIDAFVDSLDLDALGCRRTQPAVTGRRSYAPGDVRKLHIDGDMHRLRSRRRLEQETHRTVEPLWRLRNLHPDFTTIAEFRQANAAAFTQVFRDLVLLCQEWGLFGQELVAIEGSECQAVHHRRRNCTGTTLHKRRKAIDPKIASYLRALDTTDAEAARVPPLATSQRGLGGGATPRGGREGRLAW
jgi:transposase